jgi:hypothetical protein
MQLKDFSQTSPVVKSGIVLRALETVAEAATTRSTSAKQKKQRTLPTSGQKKQSSVKPNTKQQKKPRNASESGQGKNTPLKKIPTQIDIVSNDIPSFSNALSLVF